MKKGLAVLVCFVLVAITSCKSDGGAPASPPADPTLSLTQGVKLETSLSTTYYEVEGTTTESIFHFIELNGPTDGEGKRGSGLTSVVWAYDWTGKRDDDGSCSIDTMTIHADMTVKLPRHANEPGLDAEIQRNWKAYADGVAQHEQRHVDIYLEGARQIKDGMEDIGTVEDCDTLETKVESVWSKEQTRINNLQQAFHKEEDQRLAAERKPLETEIEANRTQLDSMQSEISALDSRIGSLRSEIQSLDAQVESLDAQVKQINDQFPNSMPQPVKDHLEELLRQRNDILTSYNAKVDEHNTALGQRTSLASDYDALIASTNDLVDEFNWAR